MVPATVPAVKPAGWPVIPSQQYRGRREPRAGGRPQIGEPGREERRASKVRVAGLQVAKYEHHPPICHSGPVAALNAGAAGPTGCTEAQICARYHFRAEHDSSYRIGRARIQRALEQGIRSLLVRDGRRAIAVTATGRILMAADMWALRLDTLLQTADSAPARKSQA